jgi:hypothetical protein
MRALHDGGEAALPSRGRDAAQTVDSRRTAARRRRAADSAADSAAPVLSTLHCSRYVSSASHLARCVRAPLQRVQAL